MSELIPTEHEEQQALFQWARTMIARHPELDIMYALTNGAQRSRGGHRHMYAEGMKKGMPDVCLPCARGPWHAMYIEMKRIEGDGPTDDQFKRMLSLEENGNLAIWCRGWEDARLAIIDYLSIDLIGGDGVNRLALRMIKMRQQAVAALTKATKKALDKFKEQSDVAL